MPFAKINGHREKRLPGIVNISFEGIEGEVIASLLDIKGISVSTGSACTSGKQVSSHVLAAMSIPPKLAIGTIRISYGRYNSIEDMQNIIKAIISISEKINETHKKGNIHGGEKDKN